MHSNWPLLVAKGNEHNLLGGFGENFLRSFFLLINYNNLPLCPRAKFWLTAAPNPTFGTTPKKPSQSIPSIPSNDREQSVPTYVLVSLYNISSLRRNRLMQHEQHENIDSTPKPSEVPQTRIIPTTFSPPSYGNNFVSPITPAVNTRNGMVQPLVFICEISSTAPKPIIRLLCRQ